MKKLLILAIAAVAAWWYFIGGRKLTEANVADFYRQQEAATLKRMPDELCSLLHSEFTSTGTVATGGQLKTDAQDKISTCNGYRELYATWEKLGEKMGGVLQLDSEYEIHSISISDDGKKAIVDVSTSLDVAGSVMNIRSRSADTLVRKNGKVLMLRSEGKGSITAGS